MTKPEALDDPLAFTNLALVTKIRELGAMLMIGTAVEAVSLNFQLYHSYHSIQEPTCRKITINDNLSKYASEVSSISSSYWFNNSVHFSIPSIETLMSSSVRHNYNYNCYNMFENYWQMITCLYEMCNI
ncbi:hypothetical protein BLOT_000784 [Blomia tropicalis]|nr:hypothetical protein BLOT_000784 [Blomia tropicalis]